MNDTNTDWRERAETAEAKLAKAEAAVAEMRGALESFLKEIDVRYSPFTELDFVVQRSLVVHALSTSCGTGWLSPEKAKELEAKLVQAEEVHQCYYDENIRLQEQEKFIKSQVKLVVEALERIHRIAKEVSQVTALPTEMQQMADVAKQTLAAVKDQP